MAAGCGRASTSRSAVHDKIVVAVTVDWEGAYVSSEGLGALDALREQLGAAPITHFVSAAYFTKPTPDETAASTLATAVHPGDELAVHLHAWRSLAQASHVAPKLAPSFLNGTEKIMEFEDDDEGFDTDVDVYDQQELRALVRTSRELLEKVHPVSKAFRAGGYLGTPKLLRAIRDEGFEIDSSATDVRELEAGKDPAFAARLAELWPGVAPESQPWVMQEPSGPLVELPIAAIADDVGAEKIVAVFEAAHAQLKAGGGKNVFVVVSFHQETAGDFAARLGEAMKAVKAKPEIAGELMFVTVTRAAEIATMK